MDFDLENFIDALFKGALYLNITGFLLLAGSRLERREVRIRHEENRDRIARMMGEEARNLDD